MDISKLSTGDKVVAGGAVVFFVSMFLTWFSVDLGPLGNSLNIDASVNGWHYVFTGVIALILILAAGALVVLPVTGKSVNAPAITVLALAALAAILVILRLLIGDHSTNRGLGLILAVVASCAATFGGFLKFKEAGGSLDDLKDPNKLKGQMQSGFSTLAKDLKEGAKELKDDAKDLADDVKDKFDGDKDKDK